MTEGAVAMPEINSNKYRETVKQVQALVSELQNFTHNLEGKVGGLLRGQETEFVKGYKQHMAEVEAIIRKYKERIEQYEKQVEYYENEGPLASLLKRIAFLEEREKKMLAVVEKKNQQIMELKVDIKQQNKQIETLHERIRMLTRDKLRQSSPSPNKSPQPTFATEVHHDKSTYLRSQHSQSVIDHSSSQFQTLPNPEREDKPPLDISPARSKRLQQQLVSLKHRNRELSAVNSRILQKTNSIEEFFLKTIDELKRKVSMRKNFKACTFEEFKQEDKLELLVRVLSNDEVLQHLYEKIFSSHRHQGHGQQRTNTTLPLLAPHPTH